jgi:hypothetical protein
MDIGSEPGVIREIPAWVIGVVVYHEVIAVPQPIVGVVVVVRRHAKVKAAEPEAVAASAFEAINVVSANFPAEMSVFKSPIEMVMSIVAAPVMTNPTITFRVNVRSFWMALLVAIGCTPLLATWAGAALVAALDLG